MEFKYEHLTVNSPEEFIIKIKEGYFGENISRSNLDLKQVYELLEKEKDEVKEVACMYAFYSEYGFGCKIDYKKAFEYYTKAIDMGLLYANYMLGYMYEYGRYVKTDLSKALEHYMKACDIGLRSAYSKVGSLYLNGKGVNKDIDLAIDYLKKGAELGHIIAYVDLGYVYAVERIDLELSFKYTKYAADKGNKTALNNLGIDYRDGNGVEKNLELAIKYFKEAALLDYGLGYYNLGCIYEHYEGYIDIEQAFINFEKGSLLGEPSSCNALARYYRDGIFVEKNIDKALELYKKATESNDIFNLYTYGYTLAYHGRNQEDINLGIKYLDMVAEKEYKSAYFDLGYIHSNIRFNSIDYEKALKFYEKSVKFEEFSAMNNLAILYKKGYGCKVDEKKAFKLMEKAALKGNLGVSYSNLGLYYQDGTGTEINLKKAFEYYTKATEIGYTKAYKYLWRMYKDGLGCEKDPEKAKECLRLAGESDNLGIKVLAAHAYLFDECALDQPDEDLDKTLVIKEIKKYIKLFESYKSEELNVNYILAELYYQLAKLDDDNSEKHEKAALKYAVNVFTKEKISNHPGLVNKYGKGYYDHNILTDFLIYDKNSVPTRFGYKVNINPKTLECYLLRARLLYALHDELEDNFNRSLFKRALSLEKINLNDAKYSDVIYPNAAYILAFATTINSKEDKELQNKYYKIAADRYHNRASYEFAKIQLEEKNNEKANSYLRQACYDIFPSYSKKEMKNNEEKTMFTLSVKKLMLEEALVYYYSNPHIFNINLLPTDQMSRFIDIAEDKKAIVDIFEYVCKTSLFDKYLAKHADKLDTYNAYNRVQKDKKYHQYLGAILDGVLSKGDIKELKNVKTITLSKQHADKIQERLVELKDPDSIALKVIYSAGARVSKEQAQILKECAKNGSYEAQRYIKISNNIEVIIVGHELGYEECSYKYFEELVLNKDFKKAVKVYPKYYNDDVLKLLVTNNATFYRGLELSERLMYIHDVCNKYSNYKVKEVAKKLATFNVKHSYKNSMKLVERYIAKTGDYFHGGTLLVACGDMSALAYVLKHYHNNRSVGEFICDLGEKIAPNHYNQCIYIFNQAMFMYESGNKKEMKKAISLVEDIVKFEKKNRVDRAFKQAEFWLEKGFSYDSLLKKVRKIETK